MQSKNHISLPVHPRDPIVTGPTQKRTLFCGRGGWDGSQKSPFLFDGGNGIGIGNVGGVWSFFYEGVVPAMWDGCGLSFMKVWYLSNQVCGCTVHDTIFLVGCSM